MQRTSRRSYLARRRQSHRNAPPQPLWTRVLRAQRRVLGCYTSNGYGCDRCSADLYSADFVQQSPFEPLAAAVRKFRSIFAAKNRRCNHCGERLSFARFRSEARVRGLLAPKFCNEKCFDDWLPF
jgi:hypothetical protein